MDSWQAVKRPTPDVTVLSSQPIPLVCTGFFIALQLARGLTCCTRTMGYSPPRAIPC